MKIKCGDCKSDTTDRPAYRVVKGQRFEILIYKCKKCKKEFIL